MGCRLLLSCLVTPPPPTPPPTPTPPGSQEPYAMNQAKEETADFYVPPGTKRVSVKLDEGGQPAWAKLLA